jgi:hypothetical protein
MKKNIKELEHVDLEEMIHQVDEHAKQVELNFLKMFAEEPTDDAERVPIFDFEMN